MTGHNGAWPATPPLVSGDEMANATALALAPGLNVLLLESAVDGVYEVWVTRPGTCTGGSGSGIASGALPLCHRV